MYIENDFIHLFYFTKKLKIETTTTWKSNRF